MRKAMLALLGLATVAAAPPPVPFTNLAPAFDAFEARTAGMDPARRVAEFRATFDRLAPGLYTARDPAKLDRRIAAALAEFPAIRTAYRQVEREFPATLAGSVARFRKVFSDFVPPLPIYLTHQLGVRDGGSDYVNGRKVMLFGADMIARLHNDDSLPTFLDHELFHLEHARHFDDCDQLWCVLWQEGLATHAAATLTPGASDHQLLLDQPAPIRAPTDARWGDALCFVATRFDAVDGGDIDAVFTGGAQAAGLPSRFGYYVGLRIAEQAGRARSLAALDRLDNEAARPVVAGALASLIAEAHAPCAPPAATGPITRTAPRPA